MKPGCFISFRITFSSVVPVGALAAKATPTTEEIVYFFPGVLVSFYITEIDVKSDFLNVTQRFSFGKGNSELWI